MPPFQFKHFSINQNNTAMKVGTDGVLLGAWTAAEGGNFLDIGTGTGLIAIMLAQRSKTALIDAIDVETEAYNQAEGNIDACTWKNRISAHHIPIQKFEPTTQYDLIINSPSPIFSRRHVAIGKKCPRNATNHIAFHARFRLDSCMTRPGQ